MSVIFFDVEVNPQDDRILDCGVVDDTKKMLHTKSISKVREFIKDCQYLCG